jgi:beta-glucosidase/6-phospho-beta-glucosidase/beta-galactosidase
MYRLIPFFFCAGCFSTLPTGPEAYCSAHEPNDNPFTSAISEADMQSIREEPERPFPPGFLFGSATAAYQIESGNVATDWNEWVNLGRAQGDKADDGPRHNEHVAEDVALIKSAGHNTYRLSIEWGRLFPTREQFMADPPVADPIAFAYYRDLLERLRANGIEPLVTLQHFVLPIWLQAPPNATPRGVLEEEFPALLARYAAWAGDAYGDLVDMWITVNEPGALATGGFIGGLFPPGQLLAIDAFVLVHERFADAHARAYDELRAHDRSDANADGVTALISFATHNRLWLPATDANASDLRGAKRIRYFQNLLLLDAALCGNLDRNFDEKLEESADRINDSTLKGRLDYIALNFYNSAFATGADIEPFRAIPQLTNDASPRPKNDMGWELTPESLLPILEELKPYGLPIYITENGLADATDNRRPKYIVDVMLALSSAIAKGHDVRGYYHWSLLDNFEWASGFCPRFGLYEVDYTNEARPRIERESARVYRQIIEANTVPEELRNRYMYGDAGERCK